MVVTINRSLEKQSVSRPDAGSAAQLAVFARSGEYWTVGYSGTTSSLKDIKGLSYIQRLLRHPGEEFHALDLLSEPSRSPSERRDAASLIGNPSVSVGGLGDAGVMLDEQAKREYKRQLAELREQADDLIERGDHDRAAEAESEIEFLQREIARAVGLGGRDRRAGSAAERARLSVSRAIKGALQKISEYHADLGTVLEISIRTGSFCSYVPDFRTHVTWRFSLEPSDALDQEPASTHDDARRTIFVNGETGLLNSFSKGTAFVGRDLEIDILRHTLGKSLSGEGRVVLISGSPGVGKTRLAAEIGIEASNRDALIFLGNSYDREDSVPFVPFVEMLEAALARAQNLQSFRDSLGNDASEVARLLPELRRLFPDIAAPLDLPAEQSRRALFKAVANFFIQLATRQPLLLFFDDVHWADEGTLALLNHLARSIAQLPVLILATYRDIEAHPPRPLVKALDELIHLQVVHRIHLTGLPQDAVTAMLFGLGGKSVPQYLANLIFKETEGNPFFVEELFRHLVEQGKLFDPGGEFRLDLRPEEIDVPRSVRLVIGRRLARLSDQAQKILSTAGIIGRSFTFSLLEASTGVEAEQLLDRVEEAERAGLIKSTIEYPEAKFYFSHELVRRATIDGLSSARRQRTHLNVADGIERLYSSTLEDHAEDLAHHLWQAGSAADSERTLHYLTKAGEIAIQRSAYNSALSFFENALRLVEGLPPSEGRDQTELAIQINRGLALLALQGWYAPEYGDSCKRARALCRGSDTLQLFAILSGLANFYQQLPENETSLSYSHEMLQLAQAAGEPEMLAQAHHAHGRTQFFIGQLAEAHANFEVSIGSYDPERHRTLTIQAGQDPGVLSRIFDAMAMWILGYPNQAQVRAGEALSIARLTRSPLTLANCLCMTAKYDTIRHDFEHSLTVIKEGFELANEYDFGFYKQGLLPYQKIAFAALGKPKPPTLYIPSEKLSNARYEVAQTFACGYLAESLSSLGRIDTALSLIAKAEEFMERNNEKYLEPEMYRIRGEVALKAGANDQRSATEVTLHDATPEVSFRLAIESARRRGAKSFELRAALSLSRMLISRNDSAEARQILSAVYDQFTEGFDIPEMRNARALLEELSSN